MTEPLQDQQIKLYVKSMGKIFRVTAIVHTDEEANNFMAKNRTSAVIAEDKQGNIYIAERYAAICKSTDLLDD